MEDHEQALYYLKKQLQLAWHLHDTVSELEAYDSMGIEHYYLRDINRASYYHNRMMAGVLEKESDAKKWNLRVLEEACRAKAVRNRAEYSSIFENFKNAKKQRVGYVFLHENMRDRKK